LYVNGVEVETSDDLLGLALIDSADFVTLIGAQLNTDDTPTSVYADFFSGLIYQLCYEPVALTTFTIRSGECTVDPMRCTDCPPEVTDDNTAVCLIDCKHDQFINDLDTC
jgi:hypothetical protein